MSDIQAFKVKGHVLVRVGAMNVFGVQGAALLGALFWVHPGGTVTDHNCQLLPIGILTPKQIACAYEIAQKEDTK